MNDHLFTPALLLFGITMGGLLGYLEMLWLKRPFHFAEAWAALLLVAMVNAGFIYLLIAIQNSYFWLLIVPIPVIPVAYVMLKVLAYFQVQRMTGSAVHGPWKLALLSLVFHAAAFALAYQGFARINPTRGNLELAIRNKHNRLLDAMLWMSVKSEPNMTMLVNEALRYGNDDAVRRLIRRGADPRQGYSLTEATPETQWRMTKWMLERGLTAEDLTGLTNSPGIGSIAVGHGMAELQYCLGKGFDPRKYPGVIHDALTEHPLREHHMIQADEVQALKEKIAVLLDHGADINGKVMGFTPIFTLLSLNLDLSPVLTLLIERGAEVNARSASPMYPKDMGPLPRGLTPLMLSVIERHPQYAAILVTHGADKAARDEDGLTALDYARKREADEATLRLLQ